MIEIVVPGRGAWRLTALVLDVNGTICLDGEVLPGVGDRLAALRDRCSIHLLSADTQGTLEAIAGDLGLTAFRLEAGTSEAQQKADFVMRLGADTAVAIGNGANDAEMLRQAAIGVAVLGPEGLAAESLAAADIVCGSIVDALDLLRFPRRLAATLRR